MLGHRHSWQPGTCRHGFALFFMLVLLATVFVGLGLLLQRVAAQQRTMKSFSQKLQTQLLAEAGLDRAAAKLAADRKFAGETWQPVVTGQAAADEQANVVIDVQPADNAGIVTVTVTATFPDHPTRRTQVVRRSQLRIPAAD